MSTEISTPRVTVQLVVWFGAMFALLFGGAGTLAWPEAWVFVFMQISSSIAILRWLKKHDPALLKERTEFLKRMEKPWDKAIVILFIVTSVPFFVLPGLDALRYHWSHVPLAFKILGFIGIFVSTGVGFQVLKTNPFASAAVEIQRERGHHVITTGLYRYVRHPMYVGSIVGFWCIPLALGSLVAFLPSAILTGLIVVRTYLEDITLHRELQGYSAYAETVKYRLIPGIW